MEKKTASSATVSEVLNVDNYLVWSLQVKTYLIAQDLWDIVEATDKCTKQEDDEAAFKDWRKKNAMALHVIQISCPQRICHVISLIDSAKIAWETLGEICNIPKSHYVVPKEKERYEAWSDRMKTFLMEHDLWNIVVETINEPTTPDWSKKNAMALYFIRESCGSARFSLIEKIIKAADAWVEIEFNPDSDMIVLDDVDQYKDWSLQVKTGLKLERLWDIVEGTDEPPKAENDDAAFMTWSKKNATALEVIRNSCEDPIKCAIEKISSAKIAWDTLAGICALPKTAFEFLADEGNNYLDWSLKVKAILTDRQLWDIVEGTDDPPKSEKNDVALGLIQYSCFWFRNRLRYKLGIDKHGFDKLGSINSAKIVWDALAAICALPKNKMSIAVVIECLESIPAAIKRLDDVDNYKDWSLQVKAYLMDQQLWDIVEGTNEPPKAENDEAAFKDALAFRVIVFSCGYRLRFAIWWITSAKIAWDTLAEICKFPKSDYIVPGEDNYVAWSVRMEAYLKANDLWDIVEAATDPPKPENDEIAFNAWSKKNAIALYLIRESSEAFFSFKKSTRTAQIAWDTLAGYHKSGGMQNNENSGFGLYLSFEEHIREGNWEAANEFINSHPEAVSARISILGSTALHIAIFAGHMNIVERLVEIMSEEDLKIKDASDFTVLGCCAIVGNIQMAQCIIGKNRTLLIIGNGRNNLIPVVLALMYNPNGTDMVRYLYSETLGENFMPIINGINGATFITRAMYSKAIDMALDLLKLNPELAIAPDCSGRSPVEVLAGMSFAYRSGNRLVYWKEWIYNTQGSVWNPLKCLENDQKYEFHRQSKELLTYMLRVLQGLNFQQLEKGEVINEAMIKAVKQGRVLFVKEILRTFPELAWSFEKSTGRNIFMLAVLYRQDEVYHLLCRSPKMNQMLDGVDFDSNSILHIAAMLEPSAKPNKAPGAALLMLREVQWFKEVKRVVGPSTLEGPNKNGQTPSELFIESHKELMKEGEKWMKEIANSCTVVAALIVTIMFAAAITIPGGNKQESGLPMFLNVKVFMLFIISDALSLLFASISLLTFLGFTSSRYTVEDFLQSLPINMMIGISTLIISITTMMITFCASLFIILKGKSSVIIPVICLASVPVALFARMQLRLLNDVIILINLFREEKYGA